MTAGVMMTANRTGRKTGSSARSVSAAASAPSFPPWSYASRGFPARRRATPFRGGVPYFSAWMRTVEICWIESTQYAYQGFQTPGDDPADRQVLLWLA